MKITVKYTGDYPSFCSDKWIINIGGKEIECKEEMNTRKKYSRWASSQNGGEIWTKYENGLGIEEWVKSPPKQLVEALKTANIKITDKLLYKLYPLIREHDFRHLSCGGCI